ncbi:MAG: DoxX family protein [Anaerolineales bacterium]|nr:DoxX family protein [Anaerolineales bacterium]
MNIVLWVLQVLLAVYFLWHGWLFVAPPAELVELMNASIVPEFRFFIGVAELLAAAGFILPGLTRILPWLTIWAAAGLMIVTGSATVFHLFRSEISSAISAAVIFGLVTFVAYMRWQVSLLPAQQQPESV